MVVWKQKESNITKIGRNYSQKNKYITQAATFHKSYQKLVDFVVFDVVPSYFTCTKLFHMQRTVLKPAKCLPASVRYGAKTNNKL